MTFDFFLLAISVEAEGTVPVVDRSNRVKIGIESDICSKIVSTYAVTVKYSCPA